MVEGMVEKMKRYEKNFSICVNGEWYSEFGKPYFVEGVMVKFDFVQNGDFKNIVKESLEVIEKPNNVTGKSVVGLRSNRDNKILSGLSLKLAFHTKLVGNPIELDSVFELANKIYEKAKKEGY